MGAERPVPWIWSDIFNDGEAEAAPPPESPKKAPEMMELEFRRFHALFHANKNRVN